MISLLLNSNSMLQRRRLVILEMTLHLVLPSQSSHASVSVIHVLDADEDFAQFEVVDDFSVDVDTTASPEVPLLSFILHPVHELFSLLLLTN